MPRNARHTSNLLLRLSLLLCLVTIGLLKFSVPTKGTVSKRVFVTTMVGAILFAFVGGVVLPAISWFRRVPPILRRKRERRRRSEGRCPSCGYDLRATLHQCPECGAVPKNPTKFSIRLN